MNKLFVHCDCSARTTVASIGAGVGDAGAGGAGVSPVIAKGTTAKTADANDRSTARRAAPLVAAGLALLVGCSNPFHSVAKDYGPALPLDRTRQVHPLTLNPAQAPQAPHSATPDSSEAVPPPPPDPFAGLEALDVSIEQVRAWTLKNNLDLQVSLVDPSIADETVTVEEAAWESVFTSNLRVTDLTRPTASTLIGGKVNQVDYDFGVRVPLRTGGQVTVRLPVNRTKTNNLFSTLNPSFTTNLEFSLTQPLLRGAGRRSNTHALRVAALNEGVSESRTKLEVIRQIAAADRSYWRLYAARRALDVAQQQYEVAKDQLEQSQRRVKAGAVSEIEVVRAQEGLAQRLEAIIVAQNDILLRQRELKRLINVPGLDLDTPIMLKPESPPAPAPYTLDRDTLVHDALDNRMELLELELQLSIDESTIAFNRNSALPLFTLDYTYRINGLGGGLRQSFDVLRTTDFRDWILGLSAEIPIGNAAAKARVQRAILTRLQRLASRDARQQSITQEVLDAIDNMQSGWQRILAATQSSILAARTLQAEQRRFAVGMSTSTIILDTATRLADAQLSQIRAVTDYEIAKVDLAFATGTLLGGARVRWSPRNPRADDHADASSASSASAHINNGSNGSAG